MRPVSRWAHLMNTTVTVAPLTGRDTYGKPTFGTAVTYRAHIGRLRQMVRTASGEQATSNQTVWLATAASILPTAQLTLTTGDAGSTEPGLLHPPIVAVARLSDQGGPHHVALSL